jgi:hypothetical protein
VANTNRRPVGMIRRSIRVVAKTSRKAAVLATRKIAKSQKVVAIVIKRSIRVIKVRVAAQRTKKKALRRRISIPAVPVVIILINLTEYRLLLQSNHPFLVFREVSGNSGIKHQRKLIINQTVAH